MKAPIIRRNSGEVLCKLVLASNDDALLLRHQTDSDCPWQTYQLSSIGYLLRPGQRPAPIYIRHDMYPLEIGFKPDGFSILEQHHAVDASEITRTLTVPEYFTLACLRWSASKEPGAWSVLQREMQLVRYKIERARQAKNAARLEELRRLYALLYERARPERELTLRKVKRESLH